jgi:hypothetical protein
MLPHGQNEKFAILLGRPRLSSCCVLNFFRWLRAAGLLLLVAGGTLWWQTASASGKDPSVLRRLVELVPVTGMRQMMRGVCDQGAVKVRDGVARCAECPSYTSSAGDKSGFAVVEMMQGSFTAGGTEEVLLNMKGCESAVDSGGGMVLLRHSDSGWSRMLYQKGYRLRDCLKFPMQDARQALFCSQSSFGETGETGQILWATVTSGAIQTRSLVRWYDNVTSNPRRLVTVFPARFQRTDFNQDGYNDAHILFRIREEMIPDKYAGAIDAIDAGYDLLSPRLLGLVYLFDGKSFSLDEDSKEAFDEINMLLDKYLPAVAPSTRSVDRLLESSGQR